LRGHIHQKRGEGFSTEAIYDEDDILSNYSSLARRSVNDSQIELAHFTIQEFLTSIEDTSPSSPYSEWKGGWVSNAGQHLFGLYHFGRFKVTSVEDFDDWKEQQRQFPFRKHAVRCREEYVQGT
jgi:hypothetical protein